MTQTTANYPRDFMRVEGRTIGRNVTEPQSHAVRMELFLLNVLLHRTILFPLFMLKQNETMIKQWSEMFHCSLRIWIFKLWTKVSPRVGTKNFNQLYSRISRNERLKVNLAKRQLSRLYTNVITSKRLFLKVKEKFSLVSPNASESHLKIQVFKLLIDSLMDR